MKKLLLILIFLTSLTSFGQNLKLDNVLNVKLRNADVISSQDNQVKGYYYFYNVEKVDSKTNNYLLKVTDENLREINSITIAKPKTVSLIEAEYNGDAFAFLFYNYKSKQVELVTYDNSLKQLGSVQKVLKGTYNIMLYNQYVQGMETGYQFLVGVPNKGFLYYGFAETKKYHYATEYYDNNLKLIWNQTANPEAKEMMVAEPSFQTEQLVGSTITRKKGLLSKEFDYDLIVTELNSGKEYFKTEIKDIAFNLSASKITYDEQTKNIMVFGEYFELGDKEAKSQALGYFYLMLDLTGKVTEKKFVSWGKDLSKFAKADKDGRFENGGRVFVHEIIRTADGKVFVIGEQYKKAASGAGIAMAALGGGRSRTSTAQIAIMNMIVLQFSSSLEVEGVQVFEKGKDIHLLPAGAEWMSPKMLAYYAQSHGWFDYSYYQLSKDKKTFLFTYTNYIKEKGEKGQSVLSIVVYTPEKEFVQDKVGFNRKSTSTMVRKAKHGYVMVMEYFKKEKSIESRLEKINY